MSARRVVLAALLSLAACSHKNSARRAAGTGAANAPTRSEESWGIRPVSLRPTFGGTMLDFRFKVVDAEKAKAVFDRKMKPYLVDPASGVALGMSEDPKLGALRASMRNPPIAGKLYYVLFANGQGTVRRGSRVKIVLGRCELDDVPVR
jgi:hypothetical protein